MDPTKNPLKINTRLFKRLKDKEREALALKNRLESVQTELRALEAELAAGRAVEQALLAQIAGKQA